MTMFYLIGGAPRVGKSIIAKELAKSLKARSISTDELEEQSNNRNRPCLMSFSSNSAENTLTPHERVKILIRAASLLQGDINSIFEKVKDKREHVVFEGVHLLPKYVTNYIRVLGAENVRFIFVGSTNIELVLQGMARNTGPNNWLKCFDGTVRKQVALFANAFSSYLISEARKFSLPYQERSGNFREDKISIIEALTVDKD